MRRLFPLLVGAAVSLAFAASASAKQHQVSGLQTPGGTPPACGDSAAAFTMTGGLIGCWYEDLATFTKDHTTASGIELIHISGTEHFVGCLDTDRDGTCSGDPTGTLSFTYTFTGQFNPTTGAEIRGRCHHPIVGSGGAFSGATGVINFKDDVSDPAFVTSPYMGHISF
jgi:hypothetical protein